MARSKWGFHQLVCKFPKVTSARVSPRPDGMAARAQTRISSTIRPEQGKLFRRSCSHLRTGTAKTFLRGNGWKAFFLSCHVAKRARVRRHRSAKELRTFLGAPSLSVLISDAFRGKVLGKARRTYSLPLCFYALTVDLRAYNEPVFSQNSYVVTSFQRPNTLNSLEYDHLRGHV